MNNLFLNLHSIFSALSKVCRTKVGSPTWATASILLWIKMGMRSSYKVRIVRKTNSEPSFITRKIVDMICVIRTLIKDLPQQRSV